MLQNLFSRMCLPSPEISDRFLATWISHHKLHAHIGTPPLCSGCHSGYVLQALLYDISNNLLIYLETCILTIFFNFIFVLAVVFYVAPITDWDLKQYFFELYELSRSVLSQNTLCRRTVYRFQELPALNSSQEKTQNFCVLFCIYHHAAHEFFDPAL